MSQTKGQVNMMKTIDISQLRLEQSPGGSIPANRGTGSYRTGEPEFISEETLFDQAAFMKARRRRTQLKGQGIVIPFFQELRTFPAEPGGSVCCSPVR